MGVATPPHPFLGKHITKAMYGCGNAGLAWATPTYKKNSGSSPDFVFVFEMSRSKHLYFKYYLLNTLCPSVLLVALLEVHTVSCTLV